MHLLNRYQKSELFVDPFPQFLEKLERVMKDVGSAQIIRDGKTDKNGNMFWVEFLGNYAGKNRNEDALFSTALAMNALLDTWAIRTGRDVKLDEETPKEVLESIQKGIDYILSHIG